MTNDTAAWADPAWLAAATEWIAAALPADRRLAGPIERLHIRPWSTVLRAPTTAGDAYFKAVAPLLAHEVALTAALAGWVPAATLAPLAADAERGWLLLPDGGATLRPIIRADRDAGHWERALPAYAAAQIALAEHTSAMLALGVPDRRPGALPGLYARLLASLPALEVESEYALGADELGRLHVSHGLIEELCARLEAGAIPASLNHGDLHDANVFMGDGRPRFFDWGDASLSHPFVSLRTVFVSVEIALDLPDGGAAGLPLRDSYLEPWRRFAPAAAVLETFRLAQRIAPLVSALSWQRAVAPLPADQRRWQGVNVHHLLRELLEGLEA
ncbi:MAG TPA: hypothetical protein VD886_09765 [Herpetosiphonaceae bacterium]|nr:hypothetical protein [Herpetosiphonaceae bacterium]